MHNQTKNIISFSISDDARNIIFKDEIKLQYEIDTGTGIWREAANKLLDQKADADPYFKTSVNCWEDDYFASELLVKLLFLWGH